MSGIRRLWWRQPFSRPADGLAQRLMVVTDIDGSLLEPGTRTAPSERAALEFLAARGIPLVINSSRTRAEIERLHQTLHLLTPFISEHGSALFVPQGSFPFAIEEAMPAIGGDVITFGRRYHEVVDRLRTISRELDVEIVSFAGLTIEEAGRELGVTRMEAQLAKLREYTELFRIVDESEATRSRFIRALRKNGLRCWRIGRHHLVTAAPDRAGGLKALRTLWARAWDEPLVIGFGDSEDDIGWLQHVDVPVIVETQRTGVPSRVLAKLPTVQVTRSAGRQGWGDAIFEHVGKLLGPKRTQVPVFQTLGLARKN